MHKLYMLIRMDNKLFRECHWKKSPKRGIGFKVRPTQTGIILTNWKKTKNVIFFDFAAVFSL